MEVSLEKVWGSIKKYNVAIIWGLVVFIHTYAYLPYIQTKIESEMKHNITKSLTDSLKSGLIAEMNAKQIGFVLQLSDELDVPLNKVPKKIAGSIMITDSAQKYYPLVEVVKRINTLIDCGLKVDNQRLIYLGSDNVVYPCFKDTEGVYYTNSKGKKKYVE